MKRSLYHSVPQKIAVAMSGGVDSSVAAYLLKQQLQQSSSSNEIFGIFMANWKEVNDDDDNNNKTTSCCEQDYNDVRRVAEQLKIPLHFTSFAKEYWNLVFEPMCQDLVSRPSYMPNPDISCHRHIK